MARYLYFAHLETSHMIQCICFLINNLNPAIPVFFMFTLLSRDQCIPLLYFLNIESSSESKRLGSCTSGSV